MTKEALSPPERALPTPERALPPYLTTMGLE
jgi:hypothetical protein